MATIHKAIPLNGSANLNFNIVGGTIPPAKPKDNTIWVDTDVPIHHWSLNGKVPRKRSNNKNLFTYPYADTTKIVNGITFTDNGDGSITINGTATKAADFYLCRLQLDKGVFYTLKGLGVTGAGIHVAEYTESEWIHTPHVARKNDVTFNYAGLQTANAFMQCVLIIEPGATFNNHVIYPQLEKGLLSTSFVKGDTTGQVWIHTLNSGGAVSFNAFKKNSLRENLNRLRQLSSIYGWENKNAYIYQDEQWIQFSQATDIAIMENGVLNPALITSFDNGLLLDVGTGGDTGITSGYITTTASNAVDLRAFKGIKIIGKASASASSHGGCTIIGDFNLTTSSGTHNIAKSYASSSGSTPGHTTSPFEIIINTTFSSSELLTFTASFWMDTAQPHLSNGGAVFEITDIYLLKDVDVDPDNDYSLYNYGIQNVEWVAVGGGYGSGSTTFNSNSVKLDSTGSYSNGGRYQSMYTKNKIDLTEYTKLKAVVSGYSYDTIQNGNENNGFFRMGITDGQNANIKQNSFTNTISINPLVTTSELTNELREVVMDISNITGEYYVGICLYSYRMYDYTDTGNVYSVSLHKD